MSNFYIDYVNGVDGWDGSTWTSPIDGTSYAHVMFAYAFYATSITVSADPTNYTQRQNSYDSDTTYLHYVADYITAAKVTDDASATLSVSTSSKHAMQVTLKGAPSQTVSFRAISTIGEADASVDCSPPSGLVDDDIMLAFVIARQTTGNPTITAPAGWTEVVSNTTYAGNFRISIYWKRASSESGNYTFSHNGSAGQRTQVTIVAYDNCVTSGSPIAGYSDTGYTTSNTTIIAYVSTLVGPWQSASGATAARLTPGDEIRIAKSPAPESLGTCTFTKDGTTITLPETKTVTLDAGESAWTPATNVTCSAYATYKMNGSYSNRMSIGASFTTGKIAYITIDEVDLSSYTKLSFWLMSSASKSKGTFQICLCSDTTGDVPVNTFDIEYISNSFWHPYTIDNGSALGSSIKSIAFYALVDPGTIYLYSDTILVTNDISLSSVISDHSDEAPPYYPIKDISGTTVTLGSYYGYASSNSWSVYFEGTSGDKTGYIIEPIQTSFNHVFTSEDGTATAPYKYRGGWDTSSNTQTGYTWASYSVYGIYIEHKYIEVEKVCPLNVQAGIFLSGARHVYIHDFQITASEQGFMGYVSNAVNCLFKDAYVVGSKKNIYSAYDFVFLEFNNIQFWSSFGDSLSELANGNVTLRGCVFSRNSLVTTLDTYSTLKPVTTTKMYNCEFRNPNGSTKDIIHEGGDLHLFNCKFSANGITHACYEPLISIKHNQVEDAHLLYLNYYDTLESEATVRHTASGISWKLTTSASSMSNSIFPTRYVIATVACAADSQVTASVWLRRTNTGLTASFVCPGGQIEGVDTDVSTAMTAAADTWEEVTIQFTPTEAGVVELEIQCYGPGYSLYIDDLTVTQA